MATKKTTKPTAKAKEEVQANLPKNPQNYSYRGDELIPVPANLFLLMYRALDKAVQHGTKIEFPTVTEWVYVDSGITVEKPKQDDIVKGRVTQVMSVEKTFDRANASESFEPWLVPEIIQAKDGLIQTHSKAVEDGIAVEISVLQKEARDRAEAQKPKAPEGDK